MCFYEAMVKAKVCHKTVVLCNYVAVNGWAVLQVAEEVQYPLCKLLVRRELLKSSAND